MQIAKIMAWNITDSKTTALNVPNNDFPNRIVYFKNKVWRIG